MKRTAAEQQLEQQLQLQQQQQQQSRAESNASSTAPEAQLAEGHPENDTRSETPKRSVTIKLAGKEYRLRSDASEESLQRVAGYVDQSMQKIRKRTDTIDSLDTALLTALNLAREVLYLREQGGESSTGNATKAESDRDEKPQGNSGKFSDPRLRGLIEQIELALPSADSGRL